MAPTGDTVETNEALMRRFYEEIHTRGNLQAVDELVSPDFVEHVSLPFPGQPTHGPQAVTWLISRFRIAFPDLRVTVEDLIAAGDRVAIRTTWTGTHTGVFLGIDPTKRTVKVTGFDLVRIARGRIMEHWGQVDALSLMAQLGFLPEPDGAFL